MRDSTLDRIVRLTFEEMAFLEVIPEPAQRADVEQAERFGTLAVVFMTSSQEVDGRELSLFLPTGVVRELLELTTGGTVDSNDTQLQDDLVGEFANVIAGRYVTEDSDVVELSLPVISQCGLPARMTRYRAGEHAFYVRLSPERSRMMSVHRASRYPY